MLLPQVIGIILTMISDNNIINRNMFIELSGSDSLMPYIVNPVNKIDRIYLLFGTVHLLKGIRNNWIHKTDKTLVYPDFHHNSSLKHESLFHLITLYHMENEHILKDGYSLTWKSLLPNAIERHNVKLALYFFERTTVTASEILRTQIIEDA